MKTVYAEYLQLAVTFAYCYLEPNVVSFLTALSLLAIMNVHSSRITTFLSRQKYFTSLLVISVTTKLIYRIALNFRDHSPIRIKENLLEPITVLLLVLIGCKSR